MAIIVDIEEAAERLEELLDRACAGEEVSISVNCIPMVWLRPCENQKSPWPLRLDRHLCSRFRWPQVEHYLQRGGL